MLIIQILLVVLYLVFGAFISLIIGMILQPESQSNPSGLPAWANFMIMICFGLIWPVTLLLLVGKGIYNKLTNT